MIKTNRRQHQVPIMKRRFNSKLEYVTAWFRSLENVFELSLLFHMTSLFSDGERAAKADFLFVNGRGNQGFWNGLNFALIIK